MDEIQRFEQAIFDRVDKVYETAALEMTKKFEHYMAAFERKDAVKRGLVESGELSKAEYVQWRKGQVLIGKRWEEMRDALTTDLVNADKIAMSAINGFLPDAYAVGHNYGTFLVEKGSMLNTSFTLYDREAVERLIKSEPRLLPVTQWELDRGKDAAWNQKHVTQQITQGIMQGESLPQVAERLQRVVGMDERAAMRNARTALTGAQNAGRIDAYRRAESLGIQLEKQWLATIDNVTRDSHIDMDGECVGVDEVFSNGLEYPADGTGDPAEVYNCRCTLIPKVKDVDYSKSDAMRWRRDEDVGDMTYEEWKQSHSGRNDPFGLGLKEGNPTILRSDNSESHTILWNRELSHNFTDGAGGVTKTTTADVYTLDGDVKLIFPKGMDRELQGMTPDLMMDCYFKLPKQYRSQIQKVVTVVDYRNPQDAYWEKTYKIKNFRTYATGGKEITFYAHKAHNRKYVTSTLAHEGGHYVDKFSKSGTVYSNSKAWKDAIKADKLATGVEATSDYAKSALKAGYAAEDFADGCAEYVASDASKMYFELQFPNRAKILKEILGW